MQTLMASAVLIAQQLFTWPMLRVIGADDFILLGLVTWVSFYYVNSLKKDLKNDSWYERPQQLIRNGSLNSNKLETRDIATKLEQTVCIA